VSGVFSLRVTGPDLVALYRCEISRRRDRPQRAPAAPPTAHSRRHTATGGCTVRSPQQTQSRVVERLRVARACVSHPQGPRIPRLLQPRPLVVGRPIFSLFLSVLLWSAGPGFFPSHNTLLHTFGADSLTYFYSARLRFIAASYYCSQCREFFSVLVCF
jgi:hypothetical protein